MFSLNPTNRAEQVLYSSCGQKKCKDGPAPEAGLMNVKGALDGTMMEGGAHRRGTVFVIDRKIRGERVLYSFCGQEKCADGDHAVAGLIDVKCMLYGTMEDGGASGHGTVLSLDPATGTETVLYSFCSRRECVDSAWPKAGLIDVKGWLL